MDDKEEKIEEIELEKYGKEKKDFAPKTGKKLGKKKRKRKEKKFCLWKAVVFPLPSLQI